MKNIRNITSLCLAITALFCFYACNDSPQNDDSAASVTEKSSGFIVISDLHYYAAELGVDNNAFQRKKDNDTKLVRESSYVNKALIEKLKSEPEKFVIVTGDLTGNGELYNHQCVAKLLNELRQAGKSVFVLPGNHDINSPYAARFSGGFEEQIPTVTPEEFRSIYADCGYNSAISCDSRSLSYAAFPDSITLLVALDVCRYDENTSTVQVSGGHFRPETQIWLDSLLSSEATNGRNVIIATHQGVVEHYSGQSLASENYIINNADDLANLLLNHKVHLVLTGHGHANDIAKSSLGELYDIETGSNITWPDAYRKISVSPKEMNVTTCYVTNIDYDTRGLSFAEYSKSRTFSGLLYYSNNIISSKFSTLDDSVKTELKTEFAGAILAHFAGDETMSPGTATFLDALTSSGNMNQMLAAVMLRGLYTDTQPPDCNITIKFDS